MDRATLRWPVREGATAELQSGDVVEVYCRGTSVPGSSPAFFFLLRCKKKICALGAWLASTVVRARPPNEFYVEHVDGPVRRSRLRLVMRRPAREWWHPDELRRLARDRLPATWVDLAPKSEAAVVAREQAAVADAPDRCNAGTTASCGASCALS